MEATQQHERRLSRREASEYLCSHGYRIAPTTLAKYACLGIGPEHELFGSRPVYTERRLIEWAKGRLSSRTSTSASTVSAQKALPGSGEPRKHL